MKRPARTNVRAKSIAKRRDEVKNYWLDKKEEPENMCLTKQSHIITDFDILTKWLKYSDEKAKEIIANKVFKRIKISTDAAFEILENTPVAMGYNSALFTV